MHIRPFEIGLIAISVISAIVGLIFLSNYKGGDPEDRVYGTRVEVWGTFDRLAMQSMLHTLSESNKALQVVEYVQIDPRTFDSELTNAIAEGRGPDLVIIPHTKLITHRAKLQPISYETITERQFRDAYIDGAEIFMSSDGIYGIPFAVDPLVMYWNRDLFTSNGLSQPPRTWDTLVSQTTKAITRVDSTRSISQSAVALGEYANILYAKEILSTLFFQAGSTIVDQSSGFYRVTLNQNSSGALAPGDAVLGFYTQFSLSNRELYSWNRSKALDRQEFLKGDLAIFFGLGSEYAKIERDNVNLNFDIAPVPQDANATIKRTYGDFYAFAIPRSSDNISGAFLSAQYLAAYGVQDILKISNLAPTLRSLLARGGSTPAETITYQSALIARGWLDPNPERSSSVFRSMIEKVTSGSGRTDNIINDAVSELESLFR